ncbi:hypothetical protein Cme02nite_54850 [Catellatospora methionotrophica]|uniref:Uncharacterized protein n=1 Tax=Catellatospora methionotrophica TaxID=121620 RepID=A0A8J3LA50_9ACTN|nr:hypothetical protein [Catellatospora methionotrophica]GIG17153.1 hypothetical protein Cme02nite_54850 [Catellatospora methionotrophica]
MEKLALTSGELAFLLTLADADQRRTAWARLRLTEQNSGELLLREGLGSLTVRGLATGTGTELTLAAPLAAVLRGLTEPVLWVEVSLLTGDTADAAHLYVHDRGMFLLAPRAYGTFEIQGVRAGVSPVELLVSVARRYLGEPRPALVACRSESASGGGTAAVAALADGGWRVLRGEADPRQPAATLDEALRLFGEALASLPTAVTA